MLLPMSFLYLSHATTRQPTVFQANQKCELPRLVPARRLFNSSLRLAAPGTWGGGRFSCIFFWRRRRRGSRDAALGPRSSWQRNSSGPAENGGSQAPSPQILR
jgi:hypothetical protein